MPCRFHASARSRPFERAWCCIITAYENPCGTQFAGQTGGTASYGCCARQTSRHVPNENTLSPARRSRSMSQYAAWQPPEFLLRSQYVLKSRRNGFSRSGRLIFRPSASATTPLPGRLSAASSHT